MILIFLFGSHNRLMNLKLLNTYVSILSVISFTVVFSPADSAVASLYSANDKVVIFTKANWNFASEYDGKVAWLIQFYHHSCGHCISYAPYYKKFALSVDGWDKFIKLGVVDCADEYQLCRKYNIQAFPTLKLFKEDRLDEKKGVDVTASREAEDLQKSVLELLNNASRLDFLKPVNSTSEISSSSYIVIYGVDTFLAQDILLKLHGLTTYPLFWTKRKYKSDSKDIDVLIVNENNVKKSPNLKPNKVFNYLVRHYIKGNRKEALLARYNDGQDQVKPESVVEPIDPSKYKGVPRVYYDDMASAVISALNVDTSLKGNLSATQLDAVKKFLAVLIKYFPAEEVLNKSLNYLYESVNTHSTMDSNDWVRLVSQSKLPVNRAKSWKSCKGSKSYYRGYPCGLWTLFHSMTVQHYLLEPSSTGSNSLSVLSAMQAFITNIFSCTHCSKNFVKETSSLSKDVNNTKSAVIYLWRVHNNVNKRLAGAKSEDPKHPKVQFPTRYQCGKCREQDNLLDEKVLNFLVCYYRPSAWNEGPQCTDSQPRSFDMGNNYAAVETIVNDGDSITREKVIPDMLSLLLFAVLFTLLAVVCFYCYLRKRRFCMRRSPSLRLSHLLTKSA